MKPILPGSTIGILGGGQLGRMLALAARQMGYRVHIYEPSPNCPAGQVADLEINQPYDDVEALKDFAQRVDVVTYEFENIPIEALDALEALTPLRPNRAILHITQHRRREKEFLARNGFPVALFRIVDSLDSLTAAVHELGTPCVLKTAEFGYDGKGQQKVTPSSDLNEIWMHHRAPQGVLEAWVDYAMEVSCLVARGSNGEIKTFPVVENRHTHHILDLTISPACLRPEIVQHATELARGLAEKLDLVGLLAVEYFVTKEGELLVNELAPRPHNSGHLTVEACVVSQFEQQLRAVCDLPLGEPRQLCPAIMRNLLGDRWENRIPDWVGLLGTPGCKLHLYGKSVPRPGRKMGHYTIIAADLETCLERDATVLASL